MSLYWSFRRRLDDEKRRIIDERQASIQLGYMIRPDHPWATPEDESGRTAGAVGRTTQRSSTSVERD